jgi:hypothetical protein
MVYGPFNIILKYTAEDWPLIVVGLICMWFVFQIYLPKTKPKRKWISLFIIEGFEHVLLPLILLFELILTDSWVTGLLFHITLLAFLFGFMGYFVIGARDKETWFRIAAIAGFAYFFIFFYPFIIIYIQLNSPISGWWILGVTIALFFGLYSLRRKDDFDIKNEGGITKKDFSFPVFSARKTV